MKEKIGRERITIPALYSGINVATGMRALMKIVCEHVYSGISITNNIAALTTINAGINGHEHKRENPAG
jgi:hypothetical protein